MMELKCSIQQYEWGKIGVNSEVALLNSNNDPDFMIDDSMPYAELWMGTHENGPSIIKGSSQKLSDWIVSNSECLGDNVIKRFGVHLPFLFKVLSINKALSVQAHPNKVHAEELHKHRPDLYKDSNHKPELLIALTPFQALCGFRTIEEIKIFLLIVPEVADAIGKTRVSELLESTEANQQQTLKNCFQALMTCPEPRLQVQMHKLITRLETLDDTSKAEVQGILFETLHSQFPGDVGCFSIYFLNVVKLQPGEALYLGPNEPHSYLMGDGIECMACSDNVVRAGLTPKFKDVDTLIDMLTYHCEPGWGKIFQGIQEDVYTLLFKPPVPDFAVAQITVLGESEIYEVIPRSSASIMIVVCGKALLLGADNIPLLERGHIYFIPADQHLRLENSETETFLMYQAFCNV